MGIRSILSKPFAQYVNNQIKSWAQNPEESQKRILHSLLKEAKNTSFGEDHKFKQISNHKDFVQAVKLNDYENLKPYIERVKKGEKDVLWKNFPIYFAKTSGTTSGTKYIPISKESIGFHIQAARDAILCYINQTGNSNFLDKNLIFLSGSPILDLSSNVPTGRLSGIVNHHVPSYLRSNQLPRFDTNCIEDWEEKLERIIDETIAKKMSLISGIPPWVQMYFDRIQARTGKKIKDVFPHFELLIYGGVNFEPYRAKLFESIGKKIDTIETYPASEGFIAYQDNQEEEGLLLLLNHGIYYEFIPTSEYFSENPTRLNIGEVKIGENYALVMNTNAGLWAYSIGDTIKFVSKNPYRIVVTGRIKHFISAFGEHVIGEEVEKAMKNALKKHPETEIIEFTVAPQVSPTSGFPYHEWFIEFSQKPENIHTFSLTLDEELVKLNTYYKDLIEGKILKPLVISPIKRNGFIDYMKSIGKLGGQNKLPRLSNDRKIASELKLVLE